MRILSKSVIILGGGGHAGVLVEILRLAGSKILGIADPSFNKGTFLYDDIPVLGSDESVQEYDPSKVFIVNGLGPSPKETSREELSKKFATRGYEFLSVIHPSAYVSPTATIKAGAQIMAGAVIQTGCRIGFCSVVNTGGIVDHDTNVGDYSHIAPGAVICGGVKVGRGVFIGTGSVVIENLTLGNNSLLAAGATLRKNLKKGELFYGN